MQNPVSAAFALMPGRCALVFLATLVVVAAGGGERAWSADRPTPSGVSTSDRGGVRNVILMIGDGMGPQEVGLLLNYARYAPNSVVPDRLPAMEQVYQDGVVGVMRTETHGALVVDSAASSTQLATGQWAGSEMIGINHRGERAENLVEVAHRVGKSAGLVTDTRITHATPAGFVAHQPDRNMENEIAIDMLDSQVEVLMGGGLRHFVPQAINNPGSATAAAIQQMTGGAFQASSKRADNRNLLLEARQNYALAFDRFALARATGPRILGIFADSELVDSISERNSAGDPRRKQPTLVEMTAKAIETLDRNPHGFFLMVEAGQIDWDGHNNDAGALLADLLQFDDAIRMAYEWARDRDDTLLIVTADHETGGFGFSYAGRPLPEPVELPGEAFKGRQFAPNFNYAPPELLDRIFAQNKSYFQMFVEFDALPKIDQTPERLVEIVNSASQFKITVDQAKRILTRGPNRNFVEGHPYLNTPTTPKMSEFDAFFVYGENSRMNLLARAVADQQHIVWASGTHTSTPVLIGAIGPRFATDQFAGIQHSTEVGQRLRKFVGGHAESVPSNAAASARPR